MIIAILAPLNTAGRVGPLSTVKPYCSKVGARRSAIIERVWLSVLPTATETQAQSRPSPVAPLARAFFNQRRDGAAAIGWTLPAKSSLTRRRFGGKGWKVTSATTTTGPF